MKWKGVYKMCIHRSNYCNGRTVYPDLAKVEIFLPLTGSLNPTVTGTTYTKCLNTVPVTVGDEHLPTPCKSWNFLLLTTNCVDTVPVTPREAHFQLTSKTSQIFCLWERCKGNGVKGTV